MLVSKKFIVAAGALSLVFAGCSGSSSGPARGIGKVSGTVTSSTGSALDEYAVVSFAPTGGGAAKTVTANKNGAFLAELDAGTYAVTAVRPGYSGSKKSTLDVTVGGSSSLDLALDDLPLNTYIGSAQCGVCHDSIYQNFRQTGHPYKLNKVDGAPPTYPFTSLAGVEALIGDDDTKAGDPKPGTDNTLGTPLGWNDITYVIGGFHWKARFLDKDGYIVTGSKVQYNYKTKAMSAYHDNETDKPFNCGNCHTTGWRHQDSVVNPNRQDGLAGMDGTFAETGIGCESCHGAGALHARSGKRTDTTRYASPRSAADYADGKFAYGKPVSCGECHTRDGERDYTTTVADRFLSAFDKARMAATKAILPEGGRIAASGGLIRHHEQFDEALGVNPDTLEPLRSQAFRNVHGNCVICHDPHKASVYRADPKVREPGVDDRNASCLRCHEASRFEPKNNARPIGSMKDLKCIDCHMPKIAKSATSRTQPNGLLEGDVASHIFAIDLTGSQFTKDGKFAYPNLSYESACRNCHGDETFDIKTLPTGFRYHPLK